MFLKIFGASVIIFGIYYAIGDKVPLGITAAFQLMFLAYYFAPRQDNPLSASYVTACRKASNKTFLGVAFILRSIRNAIHKTLSVISDIFVSLIKRISTKRAIRAERKIAKEALSRKVWLKAKDRPQATKLRKGSPSNRKIALSGKA